MSVVQWHEIRAGITSWSTSTAITTSNDRRAFMFRLAHHLRRTTMLGIILSALWDVISYNDFQISRALWHSLSSATGSA
ncbi:hypothetical protein ACW9HF_15080 [Nocardia gipuzkoensis]